MNTTMKAVLAAVLFSTAACSAEATSEEPAATADQGVATAPGAGIEMYIGWEVRAELRDALGQTPDGELDFGDIVVASVLRAQHQYSVAVLRLETPSWELVSGLTPPETGSWGINSALGVTFPRRHFRPDSGELAASHAAAKNLFNALTRAKVKTETVAPGIVETTRSSEHGSFACTKTTRAGHADEFQCTVAGVGQVGSSGLLWDWATAEKNANENAANTR